MQLVSQGSRQVSKVGGMLNSQGVYKSSNEVLKKKKSFYLYYYLIILNFCCS